MHFFLVFRPLSIEHIQIDMENNFEQLYAIVDKPTNQIEFRVCETQI